MRTHFVLDNELSDNNIVTTEILSEARKFMVLWKTQITQSGKHHYRDALNAQREEMHVARHGREEYPAARSWIATPKGHGPRGPGSTRRPDSRHRGTPRLRTSSSPV